MSNFTSNLDFGANMQQQYNQPQYQQQHNQAQNQQQIQQPLVQPNMPVFDALPPLRDFIAVLPGSIPLATMNLLFNITQEQNRMSAQQTQAIWSGEEGLFDRISDALGQSGEDLVAVRAIAIQQANGQVQAGEQRLAMFMAHRQARSTVDYNGNNHGTNVGGRNAGYGNVNEMTFAAPPPPTPAPQPTEISTNFPWNAIPTAAYHTTPARYEPMTINPAHLTLASTLHPARQAPAQEALAPFQQFGFENVSCTPRAPQPGYQLQVQHAPAQPIQYPAPQQQDLAPQWDRNWAANNILAWQNSGEQQGQGWEDFGVNDTEMDDVDMQAEEQVLTADQLQDFQMVDQETLGEEEQTAGYDGTELDLSFAYLDDESAGEADAPGEDEELELQDPADQGKQAHDQVLGNEAENRAGYADSDSELSEYTEHESSDDDDDSDSDIDIDSIQTRRIAKSKQAQPAAAVAASPTESANSTSIKPRTYKHRGIRYEVKGDEPEEWLQGQKSSQKKKSKVPAREKKRKAPSKMLNDSPRNKTHTSLQLHPASHDDEGYEIEGILDHQEDDQGKLTFLVSWKDYPASENSWEPEGNISEDALREYREEGPVRRGRNKDMDDEYLD